MTGGQWAMAPPNGQEHLTPVFAQAKGQVWKQIHWKEWLMLAKHLLIFKQTNKANKQATNQPKELSAFCPCLTSTDVVTSWQQEEAQRHVPAARQVLGNGEFLPTLLMVIHYRSNSFQQIWHRKSKWGETRDFSLQQAGPCAAARAQLAQRWSLLMCNHPLWRERLPIQVQNSCKNPARPVLLAAHRMSLRAEWEAVEQMFSLGSNSAILWCMVLLSQLWPERMHISSTLCGGEETGPGCGDIF